MVVNGQNNKTTQQASTIAPHWISTNRVMDDVPAIVGTQAMVLVGDAWIDKHVLMPNPMDRAPTCAVPGRESWDRGVGVM
jgi:hypothetical protein